MEYTRIFESTWLHNLSQILPNFISNGKTTLLESYRLNAKNKPIDAKQGVKAHLYGTINALTIELLALTTENFQKTGLDFGDPKISNLLREIKQNLPAEYRSLNGAEFLKLVRQSIAHNSDTKQNLAVKSVDEYKITLSKKGVSTPASYQLSTMDLLKVLEMYDTSRIMEQAHGCVYIEEEYSNPTMLLYGKKKLGSFNKFIKYEDENGNIIPMDNFQENALQRFLIKNKHNINKFGNFEGLISRFFPTQNNKFNNYENKSHLLMSVIHLFSGNEGINCEQMIKHLKKYQPNAVLHYADSEIMKSMLYSSVAFNIFSAHTNDELTQIFSNAEVNCDPDTIRHLRNSFVHGRYFYNYKNGFEVYDGTKEMSHITTFAMDDINKIYQSYSKQTQTNVMIERARLGYDLD